MKRLYLVWASLLVVFAVSASVTVAAATAAEEVSLAEWLANGAAVTSTLSVQLEGELIVEDTKSGAGMTCSLILDGTVSTAGKGEITAVLSLSGVEVSLSAPLLCKSHKVCEESASDIELAPEGLPWATALGVEEGGKFLNFISGIKFWHSCLEFGIAVSEECSSASSYEVLNIVGGLEDTGALTPPADCTMGGSEAGLVEFVSGDLGLLVEGETLAASGEFKFNQPEFKNWCYSVAKIGQWEDNLCTVANAKKEGNFERAHLSFTSTESTLNYGSGEPPLICQHDKGNGAITGPKTIKITKLAYEECTKGGSSCSTPGALAGEIIDNELTGETIYLGFDKKTPVGIKERAPLGEFTKGEIVCGTSKEGTISSELICEATPLNEMKTTGSLICEENAGKTQQKWRHIEGIGMARELRFKGMPARLTSREEITFGTSVELKA